METSILDLPNDVLVFIFAFFPRKDLYQNEKLEDWFSVMITCKKFLEIGRIAFDPSAHHNYALRIACMKG